MATLGVSVWSDQNIIVQGMSTEQGGSDAFHIPDVSRLGTNYIAVTHRDYTSGIGQAYQVNNSHFVSFCVLYTTGR